MAQGLGVWPMCKWIEDTQIPLSDEHPRRIKNTYTKLNELRLRSLSIKVLKRLLLLWVKTCHRGCGAPLRSQPQECGGRSDVHPVKSPSVVTWWLRQALPPSTPCGCVTRSAQCGPHPAQHRVSAPVWASLGMSPWWPLTTASLLHPHS